METKHPFKSNVTLRKHHLIPKIRKGIGSPSNLLNLWDYKHLNWHLLFRERTLNEIIFEIDKLYVEYRATKEWFSLFKYKELWEVNLLLCRVRSIKRTLKKRRMNAFLQI